MKITIAEVYDVRCVDDAGVEVCREDGETFVVGLDNISGETAVWHDGTAIPWIMVDCSTVGAIEWLQTGHACRECDGEGVVEYVQTGIGRPFSLDERMCGECHGEGYQS